MKNRRLLIIIVLWLYTAVLFAITEIISVYHSNSETVFKEKCVLILIGIALIEILNQISFRISKNNIQQATIIKAVGFWLIFSVLIFTYWGILIKTDSIYIWKWSKFISYFFIYLIGIHCLPFYSLSPKIRFLFLVERH
jgi:hypothetical protein